MPGHYFLAYARVDAVFALRLVADLRSAGVEVWVDQRDIRPGSQWDRAVQDALETCAGLIVVLTPDSVASNNVMDEVAFVLNEKKPVLPVLFRHCKPSYRLARYIHFDFTGGYEVPLMQLLTSLGISLQMQQQKASLEASNRERAQRAATPDLGRTLRCDECGTMNYVTWHCEKCGSELPGITAIEAKMAEAKTLKCEECGTMNYPTEWYCTRCGNDFVLIQ